MMEGHEKATYQDLDGKNDISFEVGWNKNSGDSVRISIGDKVAHIPYENLYAFIFMNANAEQMEKILPTTQTIVTKFKKVHIVEAKKNIARGEKVKVRCEIDVPTTVVQALKGDIGNFAKASPFISL